MGPLLPAQTVMFNLCKLPDCGGMLGIKSVWIWGMDFIPICEYPLMEQRSYSPAFTGGVTGTARYMDCFQVTSSLMCLLFSMLVLPCGLDCMVYYYYYSIGTIKFFPLF